MAFTTSIGLIFVIVGISLFLIFVGYPMSGKTSTMSCSIGNSCTTSSQFISEYVPTIVGVVPLLLGILGGIGLAIGRLSITWIATISLLVFSFLGIFSIGFFFLPISTILVATLAFMYGRSGSAHQMIST
jgi:hypothetical protein